MNSNSKKGWNLILFALILNYGLSILSRQKWLVWAEHHFYRFAHTGISAILWGIIISSIGSYFLIRYLNYYKSEIKEEIGKNKIILIFPLIVILSFFLIYFYPDMVKPKIYLLIVQIIALSLLHVKVSKTEFWRHLRVAVKSILDTVFNAIKFLANRNK